MALRHGVELYAAVFGTWHLEQREGFLVENERVGVVVHHHDAVLFGKGNQPLVGLHACRTACGHIGIVGPHQLYAREVHLLKSFKVGLPSVVLQKIVVNHLRTEDFRKRSIGGIAGIGNQHFVAGIDKGQRGVENTFFGTNQGLNLSIGVQFHAIPFLIECGHGLTQFGCSHGGLVAVGIGIGCHLAEFVDGALRGRHVGTADGKTDNVETLGVELSHFFKFAAEVVFLYERQPLGWLDVNWTVFHLDILLIL